MLSFLSIYEGLKTAILPNLEQLARYINRAIKALAEI